MDEVKISLMVRFRPEDPDHGLTTNMLLKLEQIREKTNHLYTFHYDCDGWFYIWAAESDYDIASHDGSRIHKEDAIKIQRYVEECCGIPLQIEVRTRGVEQ